MTKALDELLVVRCQLGERDAFDELIERWYEPVWRYALRLTGDEDAARDVAQDVWLRVLRGIARLRDGSKLRAWLFGIARWTLMDRWRREAGQCGDAACAAGTGAVPAVPPGLPRWPSRPWSSSACPGWDLRCGC